MATFATRFGPWALVAGASEGLGAAFAMEAARRGLDVVLVARRRDALERVAAEVRDLGREALVVECDLANPEAVTRIVAAVEDRPIGLLILNAAFAPRGPFAEGALADWLKVIDVNVRAPLALAHVFCGGMRTRGRGGIVFLSSMASFQGAAGLATYAASKAFGRVLAESLWAELAGQGVDVLAACAGATRTPRFVAEARTSRGAQEPEAVVRETLDSLGERPVLVTGWVNRVAHAMLTGLPPAWRIRLMSAASAQALKPK